MAFPYDPNSANSALKKLGLDYQLPGTQSAMDGTPSSYQSAASAATAATPPAMTPANPEPSNPVASTSPAAAPEAPKAAEEKDDGMSFGDVASGAQSTLNTAQQFADMTNRPTSGIKKLAGLVGTVASLYTGNIGGAAAGISAMKGK